LIDFDPFTKKKKNSFLVSCLNRPKNLQTAVFLFPGKIANNQNVP